MVDKETQEDVEHYYKNNPAKPRAVKQYDQSPGPHHPHENVKVGSKQLGPTREDYEREQERKGRPAREIEKNIRQVRERQEAEQRHEESEKRGTTPQQIRKWKKEEPYKPHQTFRRTVVEKAKTHAASAVNELLAPPKKQKAQPQQREQARPRYRPAARRAAPRPRGSRRRSAPRAPPRSQGFDPLSFTGAGFGSFGGGMRGGSSELDFFRPPKKGKGRKGGGDLWDMLL